MKIHHAFTLLASVGLVAACSDGSGPALPPPPPPPPAPAEVPASALVSSATYTAYVASLAASKTEVGTSVGLTLITGRAPSSETESPQPI
ncbi:MAG: hypothetical protein H7Z19_22090 [Chitinophagaceae bacterium]|nr:hypothetical protein [Rubrivivax sp.]